MKVIIKIPVNMIEKCGVLKRLFIRAKKPGRSWSRLIARGKREAESMPALAVETKAKIPAKAIMILPIGPNIFAQPIDIGVRE